MCGNSRTTFCLKAIPEDPSSEYEKPSTETVERRTPPPDGLLTQLYPLPIYSLSLSQDSRSKLGNYFGGISMETLKNNKPCTLGEIHPKDSGH